MDKQAYEQKFDAQFKEWKAKLDVLKAKAQKSGAEAKIKYGPQFEKLKAQQAAVQVKLSELRKSGESSWQKVKVDLDQKGHELKAKIDELAGKLL